MASPVLPFDRPNRFIMVWPGEDRPMPTYGGEQVLLPRRDEVADTKSPETPFRFPAAKDKSGSPIPGTVLLEDKLSRDPTSGNILRKFDAQDWLKGLSLNHPALFKRGLTVVTDPEEVPAAMEAGIPLWLKGQVNAWHAEVQAEAARRQKYEDKKQIAPPLSDAEEASLRRAVEGLKAHGSRNVSSVSNDDLFVAQGGKPGVAPKAVEAPAPVAPTTPAPSALVIAQGLAKTADEHNVTLSKPQLKGLMFADLGVMNEVAELLESKGIAV